MTRSGLRYDFHRMFLVVGLWWSPEQRGVKGCEIIIIRITWHQRHLFVAAQFMNMFKIHIWGTRPIRLAKFRILGTHMPAEDGQNRWVSLTNCFHWFDWGPSFSDRCFRSSCLRVDPSFEYINDEMSNILKTTSVGIRRWKSSLRSWIDFLASKVEVKE